VASSLATASGVETVENCDFRSKSRSVAARFEMGEVLLTASIVEILDQFVIRVAAPTGFLRRGKAHCRSLTALRDDKGSAVTFWQDGDWDV